MDLPVAVLWTRQEDEKRPLFVLNCCGSWEAFQVGAQQSTFLAHLEAMSGAALRSASIQEDLFKKKESCNLKFMTNSSTLMNGGETRTKNIQSV